MERIRRLLIRWIPLAAAIVVMSGAVYVVAQQGFRQNANDPQVQLARDVADALAAGASADAILPSGTVDVARSLAPFFVIYRDNGSLEASTGQLDGRPPELPPGVLAYTRQHGEDRITWAPRRDVRLATVIVHYAAAQSGYVLVGRSLREVEARIDQLGILVALGAAAGLFATLILTVCGVLWTRPAA